MYIGLRDRVDRAQNADEAARTRERFVYSTVTMTRFMTIKHGRQENSQGAQTFAGFFFLVVLFQC